MKDKDEVQVWLEAHPQEYAQFAARMNEQGICGILKGSLFVIACL